MKAARLAQVLKSMTAEATKAEVSSRVDLFLAYISARGYKPLLPLILAHYEEGVREVTRTGATVVVSYDREIATLLNTHNIDPASSKVKVDESIVGGYQIETENRFIDASHKGALIKLYQSLTR